MYMLFLLGMIEVLVMDAQFVNILNTLNTAL
jgi:hypothetical protein